MSALQYSAVQWDARHLALLDFVPLSKMNLSLQLRIKTLAVMDPTVEEVGV